MEKTYQDKFNQTNVVPFNPMALAKQQIITLNLMYEQMEAFVRETKDIKEDMIQLKKDIEVQIGLSDAEAGELQVSVHKKATALCYIKIDRDGVPFCNWIGKIRSRIWGQLKTKFEAKRYVKIPRKHFKDAIDFVNSVTFYDIDYEGKRENWLSR